ncbi:NADH-ubiquinone oxidoreductase%2C 75 kDa subunit [Bordetella pertussis]|nr:NADH-ubiquinone oxidoreductase%2C 75 kDa subunit [Bordetella pertussis]
MAAGEGAKQIAASLASGSNAAVLLGNMAAGGNTVGGYLAGAVPGKGGKNAAAMLADPLKAYIVLHAEPSLDADNAPQALAALRGAQFAVALTPYRSAAQGWADVMLPVAPFTETSGTFVNAQGQPQSFKGTVAPFGQTRPAWKVLRVLGNVLHLAGFDEETSETVRDAALAGGVEARLSNAISAPLGLGQPLDALERVADVPIYRTDAIVRRSEPLQAAPASRAPKARMNGRTLASLGVSAGDKVRVSGAAGAIELEAALDEAVADRAVRVAAAFEQTAALGGAFGQISVERV